MPIGVIILVVSWLGGNHLLYSFVKTELDAHIEDIGTRQAVQIQQNLDGLRHFAKSLAANGLIINGLIDPEGRADYLPIFFQSLIAPLDQDASVFLVDYKGRDITSSSASNAPPPIPANLVETATLILEPHRLLIVEPVMISGFAEGAIVLNYRSTSFENLFGTSTFPHSYFLVDDSGLVVYSTNKMLTAEGELEPGNSIEGWVQVRNRLANTRLTVVVASSIETAFQSMEAVQLLRLVELFMILSLLVGLVFLSVFIISRPLRHFTTGIAKIKNVSDLDQHLDTRGPREIAEIASTFNRMGDWLQSTTVSRDYMDNILESITDGIVTFDDQGIITTYNTALCKIFGYEENSLVGKKVSILLAPDERKKFDIFAVSSNRLGKTHERQGCRKDGSLLTIDFITAPLAEEDSVGFVGCIRDISIRKIIEQHMEKQSAELARTNKELERFVYVASHDLKAPMRGIDNLATWIEQDLEGSLEEETRENLTLLRGRVQRMERLLDGLLDYSRVGHTATEAETIDTRELVTDIAELLALPDGFSVEMPDAMPVLTTEKVSLEQVLRNLINNAAKHHDRDHGCITVSGSGSNDNYEFSVEDDGPGIDPEFHERVFTMFQTLRPRDEVEGSGMGLALVKKEVELHGGKVRIRSYVGERGTTFHFTWKGNSALLALEA